MSRCTIQLMPRIVAVRWLRRGESGRKLARLYRGRDGVWGLLSVRIVPFSSPPAADMDDSLRSALYDRTGMNFFVCEIDGAWHGGWFRIDGGKLEVSSETQRRTVFIDDPDLLPDLLRKVLTDIVCKSASQEPSTDPPEGQELLSASLLRRQ